MLNEKERFVARVLANLPGADVFKSTPEQRGYWVAVCVAFSQALKKENADFDDREFHQRSIGTREEAIRTPARLGEAMRARDRDVLTMKPAIVHESVGRRFFNNKKKN